MIKMNITLALSGGGVKGFAHVGALRVLERDGFQIRALAGTSAGGLIGALYAAGYSPDEMEERLIDIDQGSLFSRMHGDGPSLFGFGGVTTILKELLGEHSFEDSRIPLAVTATDLTTGLPVVIKQGRLVNAVLATSAVPGVFPAREVGNHLLVDGGILNPVPVAEARALYPNAPVVAVVLSPPLGWRLETKDDMATSIPQLMTNLPLVYRLAGRLRLAQAFNLFLQSMDLAGLMLLDKQLKLEKPEVIIRPKLSQIGLIDHVDIPEVIRAGEQATEDALSEIHKVVGWRYKLSQKMARIIAPRQWNDS
jgi:NTE family protein